MLRNMAAVIAGVFMGGFCVGLVQLFGMSFFPPPDGLMVAYESGDRAKLIELINGLPLANFLYVLLSYATGSFVAGALAAVIGGPSSRPVPSVIVGAIVMLMGVLNVVTIPHPLWFTVCALVIILPAAWAGSRTVDFVSPRPRLPPVDIKGQA